MAVMDEFREERKAIIKNGTPKEKLGYFWHYYKWHVIIIAAIIIFASSYIYQLVTRKENVLYAAFLNSITLSEDGGEAFLQDYSLSAGIDTNREEAFIDGSMYFDLNNATDESTYTTVQKMGVLVAAGEIDMLAANEAAFQYYAYQDYLSDLRNVLTPEQTERYRPYLYYIDLSVMREREEAIENMEGTEGLDIQYPDPYQPDQMKEPVPVGISLSDASQTFKENYLFVGSDGVIGVMVNGENLPNVQSFIDYIMGEEDSSGE